MQCHAPIAVEVTRGPLVESRHAVRAVAVDADGRHVAAFGDIEAPVFPRSAIKMLQAIPLVETGAADAFKLSSEELALACASHSGQPEHVSRVEAWLKRLGLSADDLECGPQWPIHEGSAHAMAGRGETPTQAYNNCSGKHTGMLSHARHLGEPTRGYTAPTHPTQRRALAAIAAMAGMRESAIMLGTDGCSLPAVALPLERFAAALAKFGTPTALEPKRAEACRRLFAAKTAHPHLVSGTGRFDAAFMPALKGRIASKSGAEGVWAAVVPDRGLGLAVKAEDGTGRAAEVGMIELMRRLGILDAAELDAVAKLAHPTLSNRAGRMVGEIRPARDAGF